MDVNTITSVISTVGFPIVCCIAMFLQLRETEKQHAETEEQLRTALENNTLALQKLCDKMEVK